MQDVDMFGHQRRRREYEERAGEMLSMILRVRPQSYDDAALLMGVRRSAVESRMWLFREKGWVSWERWGMSNVEVTDEGKRLAERFEDMLSPVVFDPCEIHEGPPKVNGLCKWCLVLQPARPKPTWWDEPDRVEERERLAREARRQTELFDGETTTAARGSEYRDHGQVA